MWFKQVPLMYNNLFCNKKLMNCNDVFLECRHQRRWTRYSATQTFVYALFPIQVHVIFVSAVHHTYMAFSILTGWEA